MSDASAAPITRFELDHLVVAAASLAAGRAWCEATFGVSPQPGGQHPSMATHNVLLSLASPRFPRAYLEIIAIDPDAPAPPRRRWYDLDAPALQAAIAAGPALVHWVARVDDLDDAADFLRGRGHDPGAAIAAERQTAQGLLRWRITVPVDGARPADGAVPLLIAWVDEHPSSSLPASGIEIDHIELGGIDGELAARLGAIAAAGRAAPALAATLVGRLGAVTLETPAAA